MYYYVLLKHVPVLYWTGEATIIYSAVKSIAKLDTFNPEFLSVLGNTIVPIIKQYDNKNQPHRNGEDNIRGQKRRFLLMLIKLR